MNRDYIDENYVIERYVRGKLRDYELAAFEVYLLDHPDVVEEVQYAAGLQAALERAHDDLFAEIAEPKHAQSPRAFNSTRTIAIAASVLLAIAIGTSAVLYGRVSSMDDLVRSAGDPVVIGREVWLEPVRGSRDVVIEQGAGEAIILRVDVREMDADSYTIRIASDSYAWEAPAIAPDDRRSLTLLLPPLPTGAYRLTVADDAQIQFAEYRILMQRPGS